ncbi:MAG: imidazole glycerol phosphate synthase subunit HisH [Planctomycetota bacterium]|jgi:glutamine amidotransferase
MIVIVDYGLGNVGSIFNMLRKIGATATISHEVDAIASADKLILPGVGAFDEGCAKLEACGLCHALHDAVQQQKKPVLGICLGMQLMVNGSDEGGRTGLGWIDGVCRSFDRETMTKERLKVPHMGWNTADYGPRSQLFADWDGNARFYFVHSFHVVPARDDDVAARTTYGHDFVSAVQRDNVFGVQFHPEKSHRFGMQLLDRFARI